jgi:hypothetical protein
MRDDDIYGRQARTLLTEVQRKLGTVDRARLTGDRAVFYAKASDLTNEAFKALRANDNLAAVGFAEKAQLLAANFGEEYADNPFVAAFSW